ncbi:survival of motor neuron protein isoform X1 [Vespa crabro]|uniref:survival of motor neuron protein isoform X1 n=1 Tax=Vespa crabro TaxID=7445 RepID=UPI001F02B097|nr:survival of motor neuron protein isoform X1 [Vespa crabro]
MADDSNVLFVRGNGNEDDDSDIDFVWDDTALIKAYDKAINLAKEEVAKRIGIDVSSSVSKLKPQQQKQSRNQKKKWCIGSPCRAVYSEDGEVYEAIITKIYENCGTCIVKFVGYGNTEKVELSSLLESEGLQSQIAQQKDALAERCTEENMDQSETDCFDSSAKKVNGVVDENMEFDFEAKASQNFINSDPSFNSFLNMMPPAPPLPPQLMAKLPENDADALSSMLMSWYISGFHTGYYHGLKHARDNHLKRKNC